MLFTLAGCHSVGPKSVPRDRFDYSEAITDSWKKQTLLNIIKLRYLDPPIWVDVGQIVSGYTLETGATAGLTVPEGGSIAGTTMNLGGSGKFTDRPTITYIPLTGAKFINGLMTPIQPSALFRAIQAGWPADAILLLGAGSINGLSGENMSGAGITVADSKFTRVLELMRSLQLSGFFSIRVTEGRDGHPATMITLRAKDVRAMPGVPEESPHAGVSTAARRPRRMPSSPCVTATIGSGLMTATSTQNARSPSS